MAFSMQSEIDIANESLLRLGDKSGLLTLAGYSTNVVGVKANLLFPQTRDSLLRSYMWNFAKTRFLLVSTWATATAYVVGQYVWYPDTSSTSTLYVCPAGKAHTSGVFVTDLAAGDWVAYTARPLYHYAYQYVLPTGVIRLLGSSLNAHDFDLEGTKILTNQTGVKIHYIDQVVDPNNWDSLFKEVFILSLALKLLPAIGGVGTPTLNAELQGELRMAISKARVVNANETNHTGTEAWANARLGSGKIFGDTYKNSR
jgi:hypothetical protein